MKVLVLLALLLGSGCAQDPPAPPEPLWERTAPSAALEAGRILWLANCKRCHGTGKAGSPRLGDGEAWRPRLAKGEQVLLERALSGFEGSSGGEMPPRGGNPNLTDAEVKQALGYMLSMVR